MDSGGEAVVLGRVSGVLGVRGWVKVFSYTRPMENILDYPRWTLRGRQGTARHELVEGRRQGRGLVAKLRGIDDRDAALALMESEICVDRSEMPDCADDEYYWNDLVGMQVFTTDGVCLGRVDSLIETGANDVLVVIGDRKHLIPFVQRKVIREIDIEKERMEVDWDPEF
jgi:16S rRNA processing protein RimM